MRLRWVWVVLTAATLGVGAPRPRYPSPTEVAWSPDGQRLAATDADRGLVLLVDPTARRPLAEVPAAQPSGLAWSADSQRLWTADTRGHCLLELGRDGGVVRRLAVGARPTCVAVVPGRPLLLAGNSAERSLSVVDRESGRVTATLPTTGDPSSVAVTPDGATALVTNLCPSDAATDPTSAAAVDLFDLARLARVATVKLPVGATNVRQVVVSPDGRWAYVSHVVGRFNLPTTQIDRGWIHTNALSILDLQARTLYASLLLDRLSEGAADPWGLAVSGDGQTLWVALAGVHRLARLDLGRLHGLLEGKLPDDSPLARPSPEYQLSSRNTWLEVRRDPQARTRALLVDDLTALHAAGVQTNTDLPGDGPRGVGLSPDQRTLAVALHFTGTLVLLDAATSTPTAAVRLGPLVEPDLARRGEQVFNDANACFQRWHSCASCHPYNGRADGLNWDLLNDGIGNPKNTRSLLWADRTPPLMSHGVRADLGAAVSAGFRFINFREPRDADVEAVMAYIKSLEPEPSPFAGTESARRGRALFESERVGCAKCHPAPLYTDLKLHDVGTRSDVDTGGEFISTTLIEGWRTAPYLHDGRAVSLDECLTKYNRGDKHGVTSHLSAAEVADLVAYLKSL